MSRGLTLFILLALLFPALAAAETTETLASGPEKAQGIPYLSANTIPYYRATYRSLSAESRTLAPAGSAGSTGKAGRGVGGAAASSAHAPITVLYTASPIVPSPAWSKVACSGEHLLGTGTKGVLFYHAAEGWSLFFAFPAGYSSSCSFATRFVEGFVHFLATTNGAPLSSFPALLSLP